MNKYIPDALLTGRFVIRTKPDILSVAVIKIIDDGKTNPKPDI